MHVTKCSLLGPDTLFRDGQVCHGGVRVREKRRQTVGSAPLYSYGQIRRESTDDTCKEEEKDKCKGGKWRGAMGENSRKCSKQGENVMKLHANAGMQAMRRSRWEKTNDGP